MSNKMHKLRTRAELERLIDRYFEGDTNLQEEQVLREALANQQWSGPVIDEARFAMGFWEIHKRQGRVKALTPSRFRLPAIAASIAAVLAISLGLLWFAGQDKGVCVAYVNGHAIANNSEVMALIEKDLSDIANASTGMAAQLNALGEAIETD